MVVILEKGPAPVNRKSGNSCAYVNSDHGDNDVASAWKKAKVI